MKFKAQPKGFEILTLQASQLAKHEPVKRMILSSMILSSRIGPLRHRAQADKIIEDRIIIGSGLLHGLHSPGRCNGARLSAEVLRPGSLAVHVGVHINR